MGNSGPAVAGTGGSSTGGFSFAMPIGNLPNWTSVVQEDFNTPCAAGGFRAAYPAMTTIDVTPDTSGVGQYNDKTISVANSLLTLDIGWNATDAKYYGANVLFRRYAGQNGGKITWRMHSDTFPHWKIAPLWWSVADTWTMGEIDVAETGSIGGAMSINVHNVTGTPAVNVYHRDVPGITTAADHVIDAEWTPYNSVSPYMKFSVDGVQVGYTTDLNGFPTNPMHFRFQVEVADLSGNTTPATTDKGKIFIDWVKLYTYSGT